MYVASLQNALPKQNHSSKNIKLDKFLASVVVMVTKM
jgi:hypothetical protein